MNVIALGTLILALMAGCAGMSPAPDYRAVIAAPDRSDADRKTDQRRKPEQLLAFAGVRPGMRVLDIGSASGYSAELLARTVGSHGRVYAHNSQMFLDQFVKGRLDERLQKPVLANVVKVVREFDDPVPPEAAGVDLITVLFIYHDTPWIGTDRARMNRALFAALKPGGTLLVADHSAQAGAGVSVSRSLHRIEESVVRGELEAAGFRFAGEAHFLRNADDRRDTLVFKSPVPVDEFVLKFTKP